MIAAGLLPESRKRRRFAMLPIRARASFQRLPPVPRSLQIGPTADGPSSRALQRESAGPAGTTVAILGGARRRDLKIRGKWEPSNVGADS